MKRCLTALLALLLLAGCTTPSPAPRPSADAPVTPVQTPGITPEDTPGDTAEEPAVDTPAVIPNELPELPPETPPEPEEITPEPEPEPEPYPFTEGPLLSVGGRDAGTIALLDGAFYLPVAALTAHLPVAAEPTDDGGVALSLRGRTLWAADSLCWEADGALVTHDEAPVAWEGQWFLPMSVLTPGLGLTVLNDTQYPHVYVSDNGQYEPVPEGICVPTLMYHGVAVTPRGNDELFVDPVELETQLQYLAENGYTTVTFEDFPRLAEIEKPVMLTFDDGYDDNYDYLFPLLQKYQMKATIFVISGYVNFTYYLTEAEINEMSDSGLVSIQSHTDTHPYLDTLDEAATQHELEISWLTLTRITGTVPFALCYPTGRQSELTRQVATEHYSYGLLMNGGDYTTGSDPFLIPRHYVSRYTDLATFAAMIGNAGT